MAPDVKAKRQSRKGKRRSRKGKRRAEPTFAELERAAEELHGRLGSIVKRIARARANAEESGAEYVVGETWKNIRFHQRPSTQGAGALTGTQLAVKAYAERTTIEDRRLHLGRVIGMLALRLVRGEISASTAVKNAVEWRGFYVTAEGVRTSFDNGRPEGRLEDRESSHKELHRRVERARGEPTKWNAAYAYLADGADVWPPVSHARRCDGPRLAKYQALAHRRD